MLNFSKYFLLFSLLLISQFSNCQSDSVSNKYHFNEMIDYSVDTIVYPTYHADSIIQKAKIHIGTPYLAEGKQPGGFDCSGFMFFLHKKYGIFLPYFSFQYEEIGKNINLKEAKKGDLILFKGFDLKATHTGHVGMIISEQGSPIKFIHSSSSKGVRIDVLKGNTYFEPRFLQVKRIVD